MFRSQTWFSPRVYFAALILGLAPIAGRTQAPVCQISPSSDGVQIVTGAGKVELQLIDPGILRVDAEPEGRTSPRTLVMEPALKSYARASVSLDVANQTVRISSPKLQASVSCTPKIDIAVHDGQGSPLIQQDDALGQAAGRRADFLFQRGENHYGMSGLGRRDDGEGLLRPNGAEVRAGDQGEIGGPWFFTTRFGVLIDSDGGDFDTRDGWIEFSGDSREDVEYFVIVGPPMDSISGLAMLTGRPPLPPKWTLGFLNSQWGSNEAELKQVVSSYRAKHIPIDGFILDFDWKAWGEDNYGEWRWNSTSGTGNFSPDKFPDGASGVFAKEMREQGIKLAGILKPRILLYKPGSTTQLDEAASYAEAHHLWYPGEPPLIDYFTHRSARDLDFSNSDTRAWYWKHLEPAFDAGMVGWWNDEADITNGVRGQPFYFDNFQFLNMGRMIYDGQRGHSKLRVWSLNRNGYVGAQRYGYAEWSGDIQTGFQSMQHQRMRMLATLDLGQPHWSMDSGGFFGHPTDENYARWIEFAAFVPIDRVHGELHEYRQPWIYGPVAEAAATKAIRLRYKLLPYIYSYERTDTETGIGLVRPLFWAFPDDPRVANYGAAWMFGDALLVSPVVEPGESDHKVYLPAGKWFDYFRGTQFAGGNTIDYPVDAKTWSDIPVFVREGSIVATQVPEDFVGQHPVSEVTLDVFPSQRRAQFVSYDDDGQTYGYERGDYYRQVIGATKEHDRVDVSIDKPAGSFHSSLRSYLIRIHGAAAKAVTLNGSGLSRATQQGAEPAPPENQWTTGHDRFGPVTTLRIPAAQASSIVIEGEQTAQ
ncbi:MAG TPA: TIM-barrel domain-containing protein [Terracidiphilus sp.]|nr:TIM-barrel domain-containing protein [Terracidiphilus sp.]